MKQRTLFLAVSLALANYAMAEDTQYHTPTSVDDSSVAVELDTIVVSGEKQDKSLKDTTSSVSVVEEAQLKNTRYQTVRDSVAEVPNVVTTSGAVPSIRGVSGNGGAGGFAGVSGGANGRVMTLVDGVAQPFLAEFTDEFGLWDVSQIEVYRGPQSTSNGQNSIGGSIFVKTNDPTFDWEGAARLAFRDQKHYWDKSVMLSGPIIKDKLAFRVTGQFMDGKTNSARNDDITYSLSDVESKNGRLKLLWLPSDNTDILFSYGKNKNEGDIGRHYYHLDEPYDYQRVIERDTTTDTESGSIKVGHQISESTSVDVILSYLDHTYRFVDTPSVGNLQYADLNEKRRNIDVKFNFGQKSDPINGFVGIDYLNRTQNVNSEGAYIYFGDDDRDAKAIYGELNYGLGYGFTIFTGLRYQHEKQDRVFSYPAFSANDIQLKIDNKILLPKLGVQYDLNPQTRLALSYRKGYNSPGGALNVTQSIYYTFDEETVDTYEFSTYSDLFNRKLNVRTNLFYNNYTDYQGMTSTRVISNMDKAVTYGLEVETTAYPTDDLTVNLNVGLLRSEIKDGGTNFSSLEGNELNDAPRFTANLRTQYQLTESLNVGGNIHYVGDYYNDVNNSDTRKAGNYTLVNLTANYKHGPWLFSAFVNNLTDKEALRAREPVGRSYPFGFADVVQPRTVGLAATYNFF